MCWHMYSDWVGDSIFELTARIFGLVTQHLETETSYGSPCEQHSLGDSLVPAHGLEKHYL